MSTKRIRTLLPAWSVIADEPWSPSAAELGGEVTGLQPLLHRGQESRRVGAVDEPVVVGQCQVDQRPNLDALLTGLVTDGGRSSDNRARAQDGDLWLVDDGGVE